MRLIDADNVRDLFDAEFKETRKLILAGETHLDNLAEGFTEADRVIRQMPTVDAEAVVRCRDCKFHNTIICSMVHETIGNGTTDYATDDGYCNRGSGKRKDGAGDD